MAFIVGLFVFAVMGGQQAPHLSTYRNQDVGLAFDYPPTWKAETKTKRRKDFDGKFTIQLPNGGSADLEVFTATFQAEPEKWQKIQSDINESMKRTVARQWQEDILGVPILMTRVDYDEGGGPVSVLTGLLYNRSDTKFLFRLTASRISYPDAEFVFRQTMQTLRTLDGSALLPETPNRPPDPKKPKGEPGTREKASEPVEPVIKTFKVEVAKEPPTKGMRSVVTTLGQRKLTVTFPDAWAAAEAKEGTFELTRKGFAGSLMVVATAAASGDQPIADLNGLVTGELSQFGTVTLRLDQVRRPNRYGVTVSSVWRIGTDEKGAPLTTLHSVGVVADVYWKADLTLHAQITPAERKLVDEWLASALIKSDP